MWKKEFLYYADVGDADTFPFILLGNKMDVEERLISQQQADTWCRSNGAIPYFETSAKDATNVDNAFIAAVKRLNQLELAKSERSGFTATGGVNLKNVQKIKNSGSCCE